EVGLRPVRLESSPIGAGAVVIKGTGLSPELFIDRGKTVTQCKPRDKPFRPRSIGLYLVGRHPAELTTSLEE
ncbi:MAG TPA: hypothetical protein VE616_11675, partial [Candidatus Udaeobacter sp.]|nr:hypothetical protein [Candidatus Udaeobacter sp.]